MHIKYPVCQVLTNRRQVNCVRLAHFLGIDPGGWIFSQLAGVRREGAAQWDTED